MQILHSLRIACRIQAITQQVMDGKVINTTFPRKILYLTSSDGIPP